MTTLTADRGDTWGCSCGNDSVRDGFDPCTEDGEDCPPEAADTGPVAMFLAAPGWAGHYRCNRCLFVFTESDIIREA